MSLEEHSVFDEHAVLHELKHLLPSQAPLKDFIHHNTLHAFQHMKFHDGLRTASKIFGFNVYLQLAEYRSLYRTGRIRQDILERILSEKKGSGQVSDWIRKLTEEDYDTTIRPRIGLLRENWFTCYGVDLDLAVHPLLFRIICGYLDQGISTWGFPIGHMGFLDSLRQMEESSYTSFFRHERAKRFFRDKECTIGRLLKIVVGDETLYEQYLFDQQFAHPGWSGIVSSIEDLPQTLLNQKKVSMHDLVFLELLMEIDALDDRFGAIWAPLGSRIDARPAALFDEVPVTELAEVCAIWQEAFEWSYYDPILAAIQLQKRGEGEERPHKSFQALTCIDDRECSFRRYLESVDPNCETLAMPGFFGVEFFFQPEHGKFYTKLCPAPMTPKYLIKETNTTHKRKKEPLLSQLSHHSFFHGWLISQTLGFLSALNLALNIFRPTSMPAMASSFAHMDSVSSLTIECTDTARRENDLQIGFTVEEMADRVEGALRSIGMVRDFAPIVYVVGHGASSVNNPHYSAYDCGACSGRAGSVNARVLCHMANHNRVREILHARGIVIPSTTQFVGALHDTTRDEINYYDVSSLSPINARKHEKNIITFDHALDLNAKERSRRLVSITTQDSSKKIHQAIFRRSVSLFEPRPELNHATNAVCFIGRRDLSRRLFLDRRAFMNSYDYSLDPEGKYLLGVMRPIGPVLGGINLEYFFSKVDGYRLGAGTKLPHNVMGLIGVANGSDGDLRPGLPSQMIEVHDPVRLLVIVEHFPEIVLGSINQAPATYEFFDNEWVRIVSVNPETREVSLLRNGVFVPYQPLTRNVDIVSDINALVESARVSESTDIVEATEENLPVGIMN